MAIALARKNARCGPDPAEDIAQEALLRVWRRWKEWSENSEDILERRLAGLVRACAVDSHRADGRRVAALLTEDIASDDPRIDELVESAEYVAAVQVALVEMPARTRRALELVRIEGRPHDEVAGTLGCSKQTVANNVSIGRKLLRKKLVEGGWLER